jgi:hypothetical protein
MPTASVVTGPNVAAGRVTAGQRRVTAMRSRGELKWTALSTAGPRRSRMDADPSAAVQGKYPRNPPEPVEGWRNCTLALTSIPLVLYLFRAPRRRSPRSDDRWEHPALVAQARAAAAEASPMCRRLQTRKRAAPPVGIAGRPRISRPTRARTPPERSCSQHGGGGDGAARTAGAATGTGLS